MILFIFYVHLLGFKLILSKNEDFRLNMSLSNSPEVLKTLHIFSKLGLNMNNFENRIFQGEYVQDIKDYPFMAHLYLPINDTAVTACGGTIIGPSHVLTAAHCLYFCDDMDNEFTCNAPMKKHSKIYTGSTVSMYAIQVSSVKTWHIHPQFKNKEKESHCIGSFDIAIVELNKPLKFNEEIFNVTLPESVTIGEDDLSSTKTTNYAETGKTCKVLGWGKTSLHDNPNFGATHLKLALVPLIDVPQCNEHLILINHAPNNLMCRDTQICSLDPMNETGVCSGDSGGPIICDGVQIGVMSSTGNKECVGPHIVNIYTRVDVNMKFVKDVMLKGNNSSKLLKGSYTLLNLFILFYLYRF